MNKRERILEMFRNKPADFFINEPAHAIGYYITCVQNGSYVPVEGEESESPSTADELFACYVETVTPPVEPPAEPPTES